MLDDAMESSVPAAMPAAPGASATLIVMIA